MINGHTNGVYLDDARYLPFWERVQALAVPVYIHPVHMPLRPPVLADYPGLAASMWGWTAETGGHALRLVLSGLFDRFPRLSIILGHMGETLPYVLWRIDSRYKIYSRRSCSSGCRRTTSATISSRPPPAPARARRWVCAIRALGAERIMFSVDYPLEDSAEAARFIEAAPISEQDRELICWGNTARLLRFLIHCGSILARRT